ncbi:hypothetical protein AWZ03_012792 [Drosophila navojoa]|uniref:Uncharacterized protein n=1 Tax=Drosophila navojoa TaxID=7232 RepID=A0A484AYX8_DRONA|nr:hypothetical protein AWZ03_012792 [Drosophila navojoa]
MPDPMDPKLRRVGPQTRFNGQADLACFGCLSAGRVIFSLNQSQALNVLGQPIDNQPRPPSTYAHSAYLGPSAHLPQLAHMWTRV